MGFREVSYHDIFKKTPLSQVITVAPFHHNYALCLEYTKKFFMEKFDKDFFWNIHLEGANIFGELAKVSKDDILRKTNEERCRLIITPEIDETFDRDKVDSNIYGVKSYIDTTLRADRSFFKDPVNNRYVLMKMDASLVKFNFKVKCPTRAIQLDVFKFMKLAFRIGYSETINISADYVLPYPMMVAVARDCGFEVTENNEIKEPISFLTYLNSRSMTPIVYRRANITAKEEYFVRVPNLPVRFGFEDITCDNGNKVGHLNTEYNIDMNITTQFPSMQFYIYYTQTNLELVKIGKEVTNLNNYLIMALHQVPKIPEVNDKGWLLYLTTEYQADNYEDRTVHFDELFEGELLEFIKDLKRRFIAPQTYIDIAIYNDGIKQEIALDYDTYHVYITSPKRPNKLVYIIAIYLDLNYYNTLRVDLSKQQSSRVGEEVVKRS